MDAAEQLRTLLARSVDEKTSFGESLRLVSHMPQPFCIAAKLSATKRRFVRPLMVDFSSLWRPW
jgi:hypothetical protein